MGTVLAAVGVILVAALAVTVFWVKGRHIALDDRNCPKTGPKAVHVILIDRSDPISSQQAQHIRQVIQRLKADAAFGTRFDVYTFEGDSANELPPVLRVCAPGRPQDANELIENPERVRKRYEKSFAIVLDKVINELLRASTRPNSPIVESLRAAAQTSFGALRRGANPSACDAGVRHGAAHRRPCRTSMPRRTSSSCPRPTSGPACDLSSRVPTSTFSTSCGRRRYGRVRPFRTAATRPLGTADRGVRRAR